MRIFSTYVWPDGIRDEKLKYLCIWEMKNVAFLLKLSNYKPMKSLKYHLYVFLLKRKTIHSQDENTLLQYIEI